VSAVRYLQPDTLFKVRHTVPVCPCLCRASELPKRLDDRKPVTDALFPTVMIHSTCTAEVDGEVTRCSVSCWLDLLRVSFVLLNLYISVSHLFTDSCFVQVCLLVIIFRASLFTFSLTL
jgi:hypothetical protein